MLDKLVLDFIKLDNTIVVSCSGLIERRNISKLESAVGLIQNQQFEELIVDVTKVTYIDEFSIDAAQKMFDRISKAGMIMKFVSPFKSKCYQKIKGYSPEFSVIFFPTLDNAIDSTIDTFDPNFIMQKSVFFIGQVFDISYFYEEQPVSFFTQVQDENENYLFFSWPRNKDKYLFQLPTNSPLVCSFLSVKGIFRFRNTVAKRIIETDKPAFMVKRPKNDQIERIQRRIFTRLPTNLIMNFKVLDHYFVPYNTVYQGRCIDMSGGGLSFASNHALELFSYIYIYLYIPGVSLQNIIGKIIRVQKSDDSFTYGIKFTAIFEKDRNKILDYINQKTR